ncbi:uncharacterized protein LOC115331446 [Ixodes scapularis]|uniref:uncharacterized protein LOC115331446 n=1 Tax=Ixodes scapularis TaxID=6945 RepID=UPI001A9EE0C5|nr:uncharacterized protein LOC115331446 [Ixodes scapularis]
MGKEGKPYGGLGRRLVYPRVIEARNYGNQLTLFINEDITLSLEPADIFPETLLLRYDEDGNPVKQYMNGTELNKMVYHDTDQRAAVSVERDNGLRVHGIIGESLRIKPVNIMGQSSAGLIAHEIFGVDEHFANTRGDYFAVPPLQPAQFIKERSVQVPTVLRPEILMVMDTDRYKNLKKTMKAALYAGVLLAAVNIRYSSMDNPKLIARLCAIQMLSKKLRKELYKYVTYQNTTYLEVKATLISFQLEVQKTQYAPYDAVLLLTKKLRRVRTGIKDTTVLGLAYVAGVCLETKVALLEDDGFSQSGVHTAAHELAHVETEYDCLRTRKFQKHLQTSRLPGSFTTPNETCEMKLQAHNHAGGFHEDKDGMLEQCLLYCKTIPDQNGDVWNVNVTAEDGTPCSNGKPPKICIAEQCVVRKKN